MTTTTHHIADMLEVVAQRLAHANLDRPADRYHHITCDSLTPGHRLGCDCTGPAELRAYRDSITATLATLGGAWVNTMVNGGDPYTISQLAIAIDTLAVAVTDQPNPQE